MRRALCSLHWFPSLSESSKPSSDPAACQAAGCMCATFPVAFNQLSFLVRVEDQTLAQLVRRSFTNTKFSQKTRIPCLSTCQLPRETPFVAVATDTQRESWMLTFEKQSLGDAAHFGNDLGFLARGAGDVRIAAALTKDNIGFLHKGVILLGTVGRGWREGRSDKAMIVGSRRRQSPCDLVLLQWNSKMVVQEESRFADSPAQKWSCEGEMWSLGRQCVIITWETRRQFKQHTRNTQPTTQTSHTYQTPTACLSVSSGYTTHTTRTKSHAAHTTHTEQHTSHTQKTTTPYTPHTTPQHTTTQHNVQAQWK